MCSINQAGSKRINERGSTLVIVAGVMLVLLGVAALAIDLVSFYAVRAEAQRSADAAALGGAQMFLSSGCTSAAGGCISGGPQEAAATQRARDIGAQNFVAGQAASILSSDVTFSYPNPQEPQITVVVARNAGHGNSMPTIFGKIFGISSVDISVSATAEVFNPSGSGLPIGTSCLKPWILPNCDQDHTSPLTNPNCTGVAPFIDSTSGAIVHPGPYPGGVIGEPLVLKPGSPGAAPAPSQYYPVDLPPSPTQPNLCPSCSIGGGGGGGALYRSNIECCNENQFVTGTVPVNFETGNMKGPTKQGVSCLINEQNSGSGQDTLASASPLSITGGSSNPNPALRGITGLTQSSSIVSVPLYDGHDLCPGGSCGTTVTIIGFLQVFINDVNSTGDVNATVLNVAGVGSSGATGGTPGTPSAGGSFVPIRLIHQ
jgi:Putative Flp pilus-assembly TadE/G-like